MDLASDPPFPDNVPNPRPLPMQSSPHREKTKRPQLSCNPCRTRKVKVGTGMNTLSASLTQATTVV